MTPALRPLTALFLALAAAQPATASEGTICLQEQLTALGFTPGPADGKIGPATRSALAAYHAEKDVVADRKLDAFTSLVFCRELGLATPSLSRHWPAFGRRLRIEVAGAPDNDLRTDLLFEASAALTKVETLFGVELAAPVDIVIGSNGAEIADRAAPLTESPAASVRRIAKRLCQDAPNYGIASTHLPGVILFCHRPSSVYRGGFSPRDLRNQLGRMLA
ncbi:MAG: peptidoglycan-binding protein, partial [Rhodobacterales bacterium]